MNLLLTFTDNVSLQDWNKSGMIHRETSLYKKLLEKDMNIWFLTYGNREDLTFSELLKDITIIPCSNLVKSKIPGFTFVKSLFLPLKLKNILKNIDIIKTNQLNGSWVAWMSKLLYKKKIIVRGGYEWLSGHRTFSNRNGIKNYIKYLFRYFRIFMSELIAYKLADGIILTGDVNFVVKCFKLKKKLKENRIRIFYNVIDEEIFKPMSIEKKDKHILFIGRLHHEKNLFNLIEAFKELKGFRLDLIGEGPEEEKLKKNVEKLQLNVKFLGVIPNYKIPEVINQYNIFILPSLSEGNPKALLEAMSCGVPCIGTNVKGINSIITHKVNGYLCEKSSESIKNAILTLYNDENLRKKIAVNARKFVLDKCSLNNIVQKEYQFYIDILKR